jgi:hypothetical protein
MAPTVRIDDEVYEALKHRAEPFVDTPNSVLRRLLGLGVDAAENEEAGVADAAPLRAVPAAMDAPPRGRATTRKRKKGTRTRVPAGALLPEDEYDLPLLESLVEMGGSGPSRDIIKAVGEKLAGRLTDLDKDTLPSGGIRWENRVQFVRLRLIEQGLMIKESGRGIWAISEDGRKRVEAHASGVA